MQPQRPRTSSEPICSQLFQKRLKKQLFILYNTYLNTSKLIYNAQLKLIEIISKYIKDNTLKNLQSFFLTQYFCLEYYQNFKFFIIY